MKILLNFCLLLITLTGCQNEEEFNIELITGDYIGELNYWNAWGGTWRTFDNTDFPNRKEIILSVKKIGSNYILSFEKSFIQNLPEIPEIPDLTVEITPTESADVYTITTLPGQAYTSRIKEYTYNNLPSNYFQIDLTLSTVFCGLDLSNNDNVSSHFLEMTIHKKL